MISPTTPPPDEAAATLASSFLLRSSSHVLMIRQLQQEDTLPTGLELVKNVFLILLSGVAILLGMAIAAYCMMLLVDKCVHGCYCCSCCCRGSDGVNNTNNGGYGGNMTNGTGTSAANSVVRKAGLIGLRPDERRRILEHIFANCTATYHAKDYENHAMINNITTTIGPATTSETADSSSTETPPNPNPTPVVHEPQLQQQDREQVEPSKSGTVATAVTTTSTENTSNSKSNVTDCAAKENDIIDHERQDASCCCSICLSPYHENVDIVLTGKSCRHVFHYNCAMDWLLDRQENDHCPYCRKEMITADELRTTAIQLLGPERVVEIGMWQGQRNEYYNNNNNNAIINNNNNNNMITTVAATPTTTSSSSTTPAAAVRSGEAANPNTTFTEGGDIEMGQAASLAPLPSSANDVGSSHFSSAEITV